MSFPKTLKAFNVYVNGIGFAGKADVTLPELELETDTHRAGGMDSSIEIDMGMNVGEAMVKFHEYNADVIKLFGQVGENPVSLIARGAMQAEDGSVVPVLVELRGRGKKLSPGDWKGGERAEMEFSVSPRYYRWNQGDEDLIEIDIENMVRNVGGVDQMAEMRNALGI